MAGTIGKKTCPSCDLKTSACAEALAAPSRLGTFGAEDLATTPPATPRARSHRSDGSGTPPPAPSMAAAPPLLIALRINSIEGVLAALRDDPEVAKQPFWDHDVEPPLCAATRLGCNASILEHLLEHGADVNAVDVHGNTPWSVL